MKNISINVDFLNPTSFKQKAIKTLKLSVLMLFVLNMSMSGVFFVASDALACHGHITIIKNTGGMQSPEFDFTSSGPQAPGNFDLIGGESIYFGYVPGGTYTVTEAGAEGWSLTNIECTGDEDAAIYLENKQVVIDLDNEEDVTCTFYNTEESIKDDCEEALGSGYSLVAKWNYEESAYVLDTGYDPSYSTNVTGDGASADWTSDPAVAAVVRKAGNEPLAVFPGGESGTITKDAHDISHLSLCGGPFCGDGNVDPGEECDDGNNVDGDGCSANCTIEVGECELEIMKTDSPDPVGPGGVLNYNIVVTNIGTADCTGSGVELKDIYDPYTSFVSSIPSPTASNNIWIDNILHPGESMVVDIVTNVSQQTECGVIIENKACAWAEQYGSKYDENNWLCDIATTTVVCPPVCGNGIKEGDEMCDDGNQIDDDACNNNCEEQGELIVKKVVAGGTATSSDWTMHINDLFQFPGSLAGVSHWLPAAMYQVTETPNDTLHYNLAYGGACGETGLVSVVYNQTATCILTNAYEPYCGDYHTDPGEECDDGPSGSTVCTDDCKIIPPQCGDGILDPQTEECDDGNDIDDDACSNNCEMQGKLIVIKEVIGGIATSSDWDMLVGSLLSFPGSLEGVINWVPVGMYEVSEDPDDMPYNLAYGADCSCGGMVSVNYNATSTCILTNTYEPFCGDYHTDPGEECDDGPSGSDTCTPNCTTIEQCESSISGKKIDFFSELGLEGWVIELNLVTGAPIATATTDANGFYTFSNLCENDYIVSEVLQSGWTQVSPDDPDYYEVNILNKHTSVADKDFVNRHEVGDLMICKFEDQDGSLLTDEDQYAVYDWPFMVTFPDQSTTTVRTEEGGCIVLSDLPIGIYGASEEELNGWVIIDPESGATSTEVIASKTSVLNFYNMRYGEQGQICGYKYEDPDNNPGTPNTTGLSNWTIELSNTNNCAQGEEWADEVISYIPGTASSGEALGSNISDPLNALGEAEQDETLNYVTLGLGGTLIVKFNNIIMNSAGSDVEIFETSTSTLYEEKVRVYASQTGEAGDWVEIGYGTFDVSLDLGSLNWAKYIKLIDESETDVDDPDFNGYDVDGIKATHCRSGWQALDSTVTDTGGRYCFYGLSYGLYRVNEVLKSGWQNTTPLFIDLVLDYGNDEDYNFNNYKAPRVPRCGDGTKDPGEQCDDGNNRDGDGCSATCTTEGGGGGGGGGSVGLQIMELTAECITQDSVIINWRTNKTSTSWIVYGKDSDLLEDATSTQTVSTSAVYSQTITGLTPGVEYYFTAVAEHGSQSVTKQIAYNTNACTEVKGEEGKPILEIIKTVEEDFVNPGQKDVQYTIIVRNAGNLTAYNVMLSDLLPDELMYAEVEGNTREWPLGDIEPGKQKMVNYMVNVSETAVPGNYVNIAETWSDNHPKVSDDAVVESRDIIVLAETGFSFLEFIIMLLALMVISGSVIYLRKAEQKD